MKGCRGVTQTKRHVVALINLELQDVKSVFFSLFAYFNQNLQYPDFNNRKDGPIEIEPFARIIMIKQRLHKTLVYNETIVE